MYTCPVHLNASIYTNIQCLMDIHTKVVKVMCPRLYLHIWKVARKSSRSATYIFSTSMNNFIMINIFNMHYGHPAFTLNTKGRYNYFV